MPSLAELLQSNAMPAQPRLGPHLDPGSLQALLVNALRGPPANLMYGNAPGRNIMQVPAQPFGNMGIHAWPNPGERMPNAYQGALQEPGAVQNGDAPVSGSYMQRVADPQWQQRGGLDTRVMSGAGGAPAQPYSSPNVTAGRAAQTPAQVQQLVSMLMQRGMSEAQARQMAAGQR